MHYIEVYFSTQYEFAVSPDSSIIVSTTASLKHAHAHLRFHDKKVTVPFRSVLTYLFCSFLFHRNNYHNLTNLPDNNKCQLTKEYLISHFLLSS